jgi:predicted RNase H-like HicB family nuclease
VSSRGYVVLTLKFQRVGRRWTAYCEELGTATFGRSLPEADKKIKEAVLLHLNTLEEVGERRRFFEEHNVEFHHTKPTKDITVCLSLRPEVFTHPHIQPIRELSVA